MYTNRQRLLQTVVLCCITTLCGAREPLDVAALQDAWSPGDLMRLLGTLNVPQDDAQRRAAATARAMSRQPQRPGPEATSLRPGFIGRIGEPDLLQQVRLGWTHDALLAERDLLEVLGVALNAGAITGYDLRPKGAFTGVPSGRTLIYTHSSPRHLQQLMLLMAVRNLPANVYLVPKVSAFLYRDDWQGDPAHLQTLPNGTRIVNGREAAVLFEFASKADRLEFHRLIMQSAKRDTQDEPGLIADSWWQPFYYSDEAVADFEPIALIVLNNEQVEATLTATLDRQDVVVAAVQNQGLDLSIERVWVNPAFYRFLLGAYR